MDKLKKAETLSEIRRVCRPLPLSGTALESFFVETDSARDPNQKARQRISETLEAIPDARILFYGHRGCGKSTELNKLVSEIKQRFIVVSFSIMDEMNLVSARAEDLILVMTARILRTAQENGMNLKDSLLNPVFDFFAETVLSEKECRDMNLTVGAGVSTESSLLGKLAGLFFKIASDIKYNAHSEETTTSKLRKRPADLLAQANFVIEAVQSALPKDKKLLVIVEDIDKLDLKQAREIYVQNTNLLTGIRTNIIYTIPIFLFHSPEVNVFKHHFDDIINLPMIKVTEPYEIKADGFEIVKEIILSRIQENLIEPDALELLINKTGGVLRHVFDVLHEAAVMTSAKVPLTKEHIQYGLNQIRRELSLQIALPYHEGDPPAGSPKSVDDLYDRLTECAKKQMLGEKPGLIADSINQILIKSCSMVEYNGERWIGVHPLVVEHLKVIGRL
ncbi:KAP family P-loop domain-containing protein [Desulfonema limicola]|uniref:KAP family P-loop domain-containing protein n=1 Tax=Desulfonema limicola TaxID=45656 RepID=A0A975GGD1_9BACT|nr:P-loop NTPase fold protein [Desulfonema limicola]QTA80127.1 KAP family P-loop domain-containing protein [Desulfonema limicola]